VQTLEYAQQALPIADVERIRMVFGGGHAVDDVAPGRAHEHDRELACHGAGSQAANDGHAAELRPAEIHDDGVRMHEIREKNALVGVPSELRFESSRRRHGPVREQRFLVGRDEEDDPPLVRTEDARPHHWAPHRRPARAMDLSHMMHSRCSPPHADAHRPPGPAVAFACAHANKRGFHCS
jgi:hypothetical protein